MPSILSVSQVSKTYGSGHKALDHVDLEIRRGEIFALLGPNGAGKTTLISIICGIVTPSSGTILVDGHDAIHQPREARQQAATEHDLRRLRGDAGRDQRDEPDEQRDAAAAEHEGRHHDRIVSSREAFG